MGSRIILLGLAHLLILLGECGLSCLGVAGEMVSEVDRVSRGGQDGNNAEAFGALAGRHLDSSPHGSLSSSA